MIPTIAAVLVVAALGAWFIGSVDRSGGRRFTRWVRYALGVVGVLGLVVLVPAAGATFPIVVVVTLGVWILVALGLWVVSDVPGSPARAWADAHGVEVTDANRDFVQRYVSEGHRLRVVCGFGGVVAIGALGRGLGISVPVSGWVVLMVGYLGGVVWSEAWLTRLPVGTRRAASLEPRHVQKYLAPRLRVAQIVVPALAIGVGVVAMVVPATPPEDPVTMATAPESTLRTTALAFGLVAGLVMLGVARLQRHIVAKPQPGTDPDLLAADDAVRASSVHLLSGTGLGIVLVGVASQVWLLGDIGIIGVGTAGAVGLVCTLAGLIVWRWYGHRAWVVRRSARVEEMRVRFGGVGS